MKKAHKLLIGLCLALAVVIPLGAAVTATRLAERPSAVVRIAADATSTPRPPTSPCQGQGC